RNKNNNRGKRNGPDAHLDETDRGNRRHRQRSRCNGARGKRESGPPGREGSEGRGSPQGRDLSADLRGAAERGRSAPPRDREIAVPTARYLAGETCPAA